MLGNQLFFYFKQVNVRKPAVYRGVITVKQVVDSFVQNVRNAILCNNNR